MDQWLGYWNSWFYIFILTLTYSIILLIKGKKLEGEINQIKYKKL